MSMNTMPRFSTWMPSGTWVAVIKSPAMSAGMTMLSSIPSMSVPRTEQQRERLVVELEEIGRGRAAADRERQCHERHVRLIGEPLGRLRILERVARDHVCAFLTAGQLAELANEIGEVRCG